MGHGGKFRGQGTAQGGLDCGGSGSTAQHVLADDAPGLAAADVDGRHTERGRFHHAGTGIAHHQRSALHGGKIPLEPQAVDEPGTLRWAAANACILAVHTAPPASALEPVISQNTPGTASIAAHRHPPARQDRPPRRKFQGGRSRWQKAASGQSRRKRTIPAASFWAGCGCFHRPGRPRRTRFRGLRPCAPAGPRFRHSWEVQRRHFGDAVAVVFIRRAKGYIPAGNMRNGDMPCRSRCSHRKNFKAVAQKQHRIRAVGGKIAVKYRDGACNGKGHRFVGALFFKNRQAGRNGQAVSSISCTVLPNRAQRCAPVTTSCNCRSCAAATFWITGRSSPYSARVEVMMVMFFIIVRS